MAPRKNAKRVEDEPVEKVAEAGEVTPPKRKKVTAKQTEIEDVREVRLPRAAKNKKPEPIEAPVPTAVKKPVKPKPVKKLNGTEEHEDGKKSRAKPAAKKVPTTTTTTATPPTTTEESKEAKPKKKAKKAGDDQPEKATAANGDKKVAPKSRGGGGGVKKAEVIETKEKETKEENKEVKPKGRAAKKAVAKDVAEVAEGPPKVAKGRGKNIAKTDQVEKAEEQGEATEQKAEENIEEDEMKENGNGDEAEEPEAEEPKEVKKGKGRQAAKKGKVVLKAKSSAVAESVDDDAPNQPIVKQDENGHKMGIRVESFLTNACIDLSASYDHRGKARFFPIIILINFKPSTDKIIDTFWTELLQGAPCGFI